MNMTSPTRAGQRDTSYHCENCLRPSDGRLGRLVEGWAGLLAAAWAEGCAGIAAASIPAAPPRRPPPPARDPEGGGWDPLRTRVFCFPRATGRPVSQLNPEEWL